MQNEDGADVKGLIASSGSWRRHFAAIRWRLAQIALHDAATAENHQRAHEAAATEARMRAEVLPLTTRSRA